MRIERLVGPCGKLPILIRDDDTNFFTKDHMLESIYSEAWNKGFKVSLSVVPSQRGFDDLCVPPDLRQTGLLYSITNNESLVKFLNDKIRRDTIEILQHGFCHSIVRGYRGEFGINSSDQEANLNTAIGIIKQAFGIHPNFFVPPYDDISYKNLQLVRKYDMVPIYGQENIHKFFRSSYIPTFLKKRVAKQIYNKLGKSAFIVPVSVNIYGNNNINSTSSTRNNHGNDDNSSIAAGDAEVITTLPPIGLRFEKLISVDSFLDSVSKIVSFARSNRSKMGSLCIINHYHQYFYDWSQSITRGEMFSIWQKLLSYLAGDSTYDNNYVDFGWKTTFSELYNRVLKIQRMITVSKTGSKVTVESISESENIDNFSFQIDHGDLEKSNVDDDDVMFEKETKIITIKRILPKSKFTIYLNE
jgi:hypothetical protein